MVASGTVADRRVVLSPKMADVLLLASLLESLEATNIRAVRTLAAL